MPIPKRKKGEAKKSFLGRVISSEVKKGRPQKQAIAIAFNTIRRTKRGKKK
jgi:hypothetical protein